MGKIDLVPINAPAIFLKNGECCYYKDRFYQIKYVPLIGGADEISKKSLNNLRGKSIDNIIHSTIIIKEKIILYVLDTRIILLSKSGLFVLRLNRISSYDYSDGILFFRLVNGTVCKLYYSGQSIDNLLHILAVLQEKNK